MRRFIERFWQPDFPFDPARSKVFYGWIVAAATTIGTIASIPGQTMGVSVFTDTFIEVLKVERIHLTQAYLCGTALSGFMISWGGRLFDRFRARKTIVIASLLFGVSLLFMGQMDRIVAALGFADVPWFGLVIAAIGFLGIRFLGQGMLTLCSRSMLSKWWNLRRGRMVAITGIFISFSFAIAPRFLDWQIQTFSWRGAYAVNALCIGFGMAIIGWLLYRDSPEECGLKMDNGWVPGQSNDNPDTYLAKEFTYPEARRTYAFWMISAALAFQSLYGTGYTFHVLDLARHFSVSKTTMLNFFIYSSVFSVVVNFTVGYISDRTRLRFIITFMSLMGGINCLGVLYLPDKLGVVLLIAGSAGSWGSFPILISVAFARFFGRTHLGAISGASMAWLVWGSAIGPYLFSAGNRYFGGYEFVFLASLLVYCGLGIGGMFAQNPSRNAKA